MKQQHTKNDNRCLCRSSFPSQDNVYFEAFRKYLSENRIHIPLVLPSRLRQREKEHMSFLMNQRVIATLSLNAAYLLKYERFRGLEFRVHGTPWVSVREFHEEW